MAISRRAAALGAVLCVAALAAWAWWRMGGVVIETRAAPAHAGETSADAHTLKLLCYNVQARPFFDGARRKFEYISPLLNEYPLVAVQECFTSYRRLWEGTTHPNRIYHSRLQAPWKLVGSGLSVLSRYPVDAVETHIFSTWGRRQNMPASKGIVLARLRAGPYPLDFYTTHMEAGRTPEAMVSRRAQAQELIAFVRRHTPDGRALVFAGDFNMRPTRRGVIARQYQESTPPPFDELSREEVFDAILAALGVKDLAEALGQHQDNGVDRVLFRGGGNVTITPVFYTHALPGFVDPDGRPLSDHEPRFAELRLSASAR